MPTYTDVFSDRTRYSLVLVVTQGTQDIANNRTLMSWSLRVDETTENGSWSYSAASWSAYVNGGVGSGSFTYDFRSTNSVALGSGSVWVPHNADGTKSIWVEGNVPGGTVIGAAYVGATLAITTIPRASAVSWAVQTGTKYMGSTYTLNTNRASSSFTHTVTWTFGSKSGTVGTGIGASVDWLIPADLATEVPNATSGNGVLTTKTYSGATLIGTKTSGFAAAVPTSVVPSFTTITVSEATPGVAANVGAYVQGVSKLNLAITGAAGVDGSTITSYKIEVAGQTINAVSGTSLAINASGTVAVKGTITDSRGRTATKTVNITVLAYAPPTLNAVTVQRSLSGGTPNEEGTYLRVNINAAVQSLMNGTQRNALRYKVSTRLKGAATWTVKVDTTTTGITFNSYVNVGTYSITDSYDVLVEVIDDFATSAIIIQVPVAKIFMHWDASDGVGIGKYREQGALDVAGDIYSTTAMRAPVLYQNGRATLSFQQRVIFTANGTFSKASYPWLRAIRVMVVGGGGSGAGSGGASGGQNSYGTGGGSGAYAESFITDIAGLAASTTVTVGAGGAATAAGAIDGNAGAASSFGVLVSAGGGGGGYTKPNTTLGGYVQGGTPGVATAGEIQLGGSPGGQGAGLNTLSQSGNGGSSIFGGGGFGPATGAGSGANAGSPGTAWGAGGSGAATNAGGTARASGAGAAGVVIVELYA